MAKLNILEINYPMNCRDAFENMATHIFCVKLNLTEGVNRPKNHKGIESEPIKIGSKVYAYQAKYYDSASKLSEKKASIISCIREARQQGVTDLLFFVNKDHTEDSKTGETASYKKEIEAVAKGIEGEPDIELDWWTLSRIEQTLDMPKYKYISDLYLGNSEINSHGVSSFYDYIYNECIDNSESELYGGMSLLDSYIEPTLEINDTARVYYSSLRGYLEKWVEDAAPITVICGEPGHGKTSLCYKAMCDYYIEGWLAGKVSNVFCFSLNPVNTNALTNGSLNIYDLLSWGDDRQNQKIQKDSCRGALVFFDGFDELKEWYPRIELEVLIKNHIIPFQKSTNSHIVITSRTMAVDPEKSSYTMRNGMQIPINKLQPIRGEIQYSWIKNYIQYVRETSPEKADEIEGYYKKYKELFDNQLTDVDSLKELLGIPIIFRMIVTACYIPQKGQGFTAIYDELFDITWERHRRQDDKDPLTVKAKLAEHALQIFIDNNMTAETDLSGNPPWIFSFYTTHEGRRRIGFLHRSFYQYFLAYEILSWYEKYACDNKLGEFINRFSYLSRRRLDGTTLTFIKEFYEQVGNKEAISTAINESYKMLKMTDGILPLPINDGVSEKCGLITPLERANNVFWNIISIGSVCCSSLSTVSVNETSLRIFDLSGSRLLHAQFQKSVLMGGKLSGANLSGADLSDADLSRAVLYEATLRDADFTRADLSGAVFSGADLNKTVLRDADLSGADLSGADLHDADLSGARLNTANLRDADLSGAVLSTAKLRDADLSRAVLSNAKLCDADLSGARLSRTVLRDADLSGADLSGADLHGVDLRGADLSGAVLSTADLSGARLSASTLSDADLRGARLNGARLSNADLSRARLSTANLSTADLSGACLSGARLSTADLGGAILSGADLSDADLSRADLSRTDLSRAILSGVDLSDADLSRADLSDADLSGAILSGADLSDADLSRADLRSTKLWLTELIEADVNGVRITKEENEYICKQSVKNIDKIRIIAKDK